MGSNVRLTQRVSRPCPTKEKPNHFKDIKVGSEGEVMGYCEDAPIVTFKVTDGCEPRDLVHTHDSNKLVLSSEYVKTEKEKHAEAPEESSEQPLAPKGFEFLHKHLLEKDKTKVTLVSWKKLQQEGSDVQVLHDTKAYISVLANLIRQEFPQYTEADFAVVHRYPSSTAPEREPLVEVWTRRKFEANEDLFVPGTTEIKDRYWTQSKSVMVNLPRTTSRSIGGKTLALDGRLRADFKEARSQDLGREAKPAQRGSLFFAVERTTEKDEANLFLSYVSSPVTAAVKLPGGKKLKLTAAASELPEMPMLSNPHLVPAKTRLVAIDDLALNAIRVKQHEEKVQECIAAAKAAGGKADQKVAPKVKSRPR